MNYSFLTFNPKFICTLDIKNFLDEAMIQYMLCGSSDLLDNLAL